MNSPTGIAVSGNDLFIASFSSQEHSYVIGEYTTSGSTVNASLITGFDASQGIAISGNNLFVSNTGDGTVGEYTTSGATVNTSLISGLGTPYGIVISPVPEPSTIALAALCVTTLCLRRWRK